VLLDQQLWCWGRDILSARGNLLSEYGAERIRAPPASDAGSLYLLRPDRRTNLALRGFGVFCGKLNRGGIFIRRYSFRPLRIARHVYPRDAFEPTQLPPMRRPATREAKAVGELLAVLCRACAEYEQFVVDAYGIRYRVGTLLKWRRLGKTVVPAIEMAATWLRLAECIERMTFGDKGKLLLGPTARLES
jgi:hypothetical protein